MNKYILYISCFLVVFSCKEKPETTQTITQEKVQEKYWKIVAASDSSKPIARHEASFVKVKDKFYLLGGRGIRPVSIYNPQINSWSEGAKPPIEMHHFQPVVYKDKIYLLGVMTGKYPAENPVSHIYIYDPIKDSWTKGNEIPEERRRGSTGNILHNGKIYMTCGIKNGHIGDHKNWMDSYDLETGTWKVLANAPRARDHFQTVLVNDIIYALAGRNSQAESTEGVFAHTISEVDVYDISSNTWKTLPNNMPTLRAGNSATFFDNQILVIGGESHNQKKAHSEVEALDPETNEWKTLAPLNTGRHGSGVLEYNSELYIASGSGNQGGAPELESMEKYGH